MSINYFKKKLNHKDSNFKLKHLFYKHVSLSVYMQQFKDHVHEHFDSCLKKIQILSHFKILLYNVHHPDLQSRL